MVLSSRWKTPGEDGNPEKVAQVENEVKPAVRAELRGKETVILVTPFGFPGNMSSRNHPETFNNKPKTLC